MATSRGFTQPLGQAPRRAAPIQPLAAPPPAAPRSFPAGEAPPGAEALKLTKTSGAAGIQAAEKESNAGLPFRENVPPAGADEALIGYQGTPQQAVLTGLRELGYDPASSNPAVRSLVEGADAIHQAYLIHRVLNTPGTLMADQDEAARDYATFVRGVVARGSTRTTANEALRNVGAAARTLQGMVNTGGVQGERLQAAQDQLLGGQGQNYFQTLADLAGQAYANPLDPGRLAAAEQNIGRARARALSTPNRALSDLINIRV